MRNGCRWDRKPRHRETDGPNAAAGREPDDRSLPEPELPSKARLSPDPSERLRSGETLRTPWACSTAPLRSTTTRCPASAKIAAITDPPALSRRSRRRNSRRTRRSAFDRRRPPPRKRARVPSRSVPPASCAAVSVCTGRDSVDRVAGAGTASSTYSRNEPARGDGSRSKPVSPSSGLARTRAW